MKNRKGIIIVGFLLLVVTGGLIWTFQILKSKDTEIANLTWQVEGQQKLILEIKEEATGLKADLESERQKNQQLERDYSELKSVNSSEYAVIGVDSYGRGVVIPMKVEIKKGKGHILLNIANVYFDTSLQNSAQKAVKIATEITKTNLTGRDILIIINAPSDGKPEISGESGGAAMCAAIVAAIQNKTVDQKVLMTGTIELDHTIGSVGAVNQKAIAAKESGASKFIIPVGQNVWIDGLEILEIYKIENALTYMIK